LQAIRAIPGARVDRLPEQLPADIAHAWPAAIAAGDVDAATLAQAAARVLGVPVLDVRQPEPRALRLLPERIARRLNVLPLAITHDHVVIAAADPHDLAVESDVEFAVGRRVVLAPADPGLIRGQLDVAFSPDRAIDAIASGFNAREAAVVLEEDLKPIAQNLPDPTGAVRRLAATLLHDAVVQGASDIHLAGDGTQAVVRYRIDGIMRQVLSMPVGVYDRVVSRLKVIGGLDISDNRRPQDGRSRIVVDGASVDLRISSLPLETGGERLVIRLLGHGAISSLDALDLVEPERSQLLHLMDLADGLVLMTGPTGSGKTTTLHAALQRRLRPEVTIMTVENPVEYRIAGISQVQVEPKAGLTFASALRAMLRQDPDIILVGEIRDPETAATAAQAAMTGHLVLSTVHAEDAPGALIRLRDLGLQLDTLTETFRGAAAQRLLRKLCPACSAPCDAATASEAERRYAELTGALPPRRAVGCTACAYTGYKGRMPIHQVFTVSDGIKDLLLRQASLEDVRRVARSEGMRSLGESAHTRIAAGVTSVDEAERTLGARFWDDLAGRDAPADATAGRDESTVALDASDEAAIAASRARARASATGAIIVFSEDADTREWLLRGCASAGATVHAAGTPAEVARLATHVQNVRLLILHLGGRNEADPLSAIALLTELRRLIGELTLPVLLLAPENHPVLPTLLAAAGVDDYLTMPVDDATIARRAQAALRRSTALHAIA
jgi:type II secretory ATPase GspE/PulE/Tfp pilus assembly ATPase PilB-like protein/CheY-like chemotaxis protein